MMSHALLKQKVHIYIFLAWMLSLFATLGSLFIGEVMGMMPCNLCWYQRIAMFPLPFILGAAVYSQERSSVLAGLAITIVGTVIAVFHSLFYAGLIPRSVQPCGTGPSCADDKLELFSNSSLPLVLPYASALAFCLIMFFLCTAVFCDRKAKF